jgi:hypothetical protein
MGSGVDKYLGKWEIFENCDICNGSGLIDWIKNGIYDG